MSIDGPGNDGLASDGPASEGLASEGLASDGLVQARLRGLVAAVERLAAAGSMADAVEAIRTTARRLVGADGITVVLRDGEACHYVEEDAIAPLWKGQRFPAESCISGWAMAHGETAVVADTAADPRIPQHLYADTFVKSLVMVPVRAADPLGAIGAYWSEAFEPSREAIETLETLARAAAAAFENARLIAALSRALNEAEHSRDELRHRVKNSFTVAQALASLTLPPIYARTLSARFAALSRAYELIDQKLSREAWIALDELVEAELAAYRNELAERVVVAGPPVILPGTQAIAIGLVLNELATNALKYGALSSRRGSVRVSWRTDQGHLILEWQEVDGPEVRAAAIESFGSRLLKRLVEGQLKGTINRVLGPGGVSCVIEVPGIAMPALAG